jgi:hypothetical protein
MPEGLVSPSKARSFQSSGEEHSALSNVVRAERSWGI